MAAHGLMLEALRRLVRQQTVRIGQPVANLFGGVAGEGPPLAQAARQTWLWMRIPGRTTPAIEEFYASVGASAAQQDIVQGRDGVTVVNAGVKMVHLLRGVVKVPTSMTIPIAVSTGTAQGELVLLINGVPQRRGNDSLGVSVALNKGSHLIEILAYSAAVGVSVPPTLEISATQDALAKPQWESVTSDYTDPALGLASVRLQWYNDVRAGGWRLMRRRVVHLGSIEAVSNVDAHGEFTIEMLGDVSAQVTHGDEISAGSQLMGTVVGAVWEDSDDTTAIRIRLDLERFTSADFDWVGRVAVVGQFSEIARIRRTTIQGIIRWDDLQVKVGDNYEYKLQAFGLLDENSVSPWSDIAYVRAGDIVPPGPIVFGRRYPRITADAQIICKFTTPSDEDYAGVRVYFETYHETGYVASHDSSTVWSELPISWVYSANSFLRLENIDGSGGAAYYEILDVTDTAILVSGDIEETIEAETLFRITSDQVVKVDYGKPNQDDDFSFQAVMSGENNEYVVSGRYIFRSFDHVGNELMSGAPEWEATNRYLLQPVTRVNFESKAADGTLSTIVVQATFATDPLIQDLWSGDVAFVSGDVFRPSGSRVFRPGDFGETDLDWMFVRIWAPNDADVPVQVRRCVYVDPDGTVYVDQPFVTSGDFQVISGDRWTVMDGATYYYEGLTKAPTKATLYPIYGPQFFVRASGDQIGKYVEFYSRIDGMLEEDLQRYLVDNDDLPQIRKLLLSEPVAYRLRVRIADLDDDVKYWKCYSKKTGAGRTRINNNASLLWPTTTGQADGPIDQAYLRWYEHIDQGLAFSHDAGAGTWRVIVVPENSIGTEGPRITGTKIIDGNPDEDSEIINLAVTAHDDTSTDRYGNLIYWEHNLESEEPVPTEVRIYARRMDGTSSTSTSGRTRLGAIDLLGGQSEITWTSAGGRTRVGELPERRRWIDQDAELGSDPWIAEDDDGTTFRTLGGSFVHSGLPPRVGDGEGSIITWIYTIALHDHDTGELKSDPIEVKYTSNYAITGGTESPGVAVLNGVSSSIAYMGSNTPDCSDPLVFRVSWSASNTTQDYYFSIHQQRYYYVSFGDGIVIGDQFWSEVVTSVPYNRRVWDFTQAGLYGTTTDINPFLAHLRARWRVYLHRASDGVILQIMETGDVATHVAECGS